MRQLSPSPTPAIPELCVQPGVLVFAHCIT
jgi:hypothetical protein